MFILAGCDAEWGFFGELIFDFAAGCDTLERRLIGPGTGILATHEPRSRLIDQVPRSLSVVGHFLGLPVLNYNR